MYNMIIDLLQNIIQFYENTNSVNVQVWFVNHVNSVKKIFFKFELCTSNLLDDGHLTIIQIIFNINCILDVIVSLL